MYEIIFYCDKKGNIPVLQYLEKLKGESGKSSRIRLNKAHKYIQALSQYGTTLPDTYVKHLEGDIWELRPGRDRVLFAGFYGGKFILLHQFVKKTQKTPKREIAKAKREFKDYIERSNDE